MTAYIKYFSDRKITKIAEINTQTKTTKLLAGLTDRWPNVDFTYCIQDDKHIIYIPAILDHYTITEFCRGFLYHTT